MDWQHFIDTAVGLVIAAMTWFARLLFSGLEQVKRDLSNLRDESHQRYVSRDDYKADLQEVKAMLGRIFDKLDNKMDK